jgi:hypothetical protein
MHAPAEIHTRMGLFTSLYTDSFRSAYGDMQSAEQVWVHTRTHARTRVCGAIPMPNPYAYGAMPSAEKVSLLAHMRGSCLDPSPLSSSHFLPLLLLPPLGCWPDLPAPAVPARPPPLTPPSLPFCIHGTSHSPASCHSQVAGLTSLLRPYLLRLHPPPSPCYPPLLLSNLRLPV